MTPTLRDRLVRYGPIAGVLLVGALYALWQLLGGAPESQDSKAYYMAGLDDPYSRGNVGNDFAFLYSPAFSQLMVPFRLLPIGVFVALWTLLLVAAMAWTAGRLSLPLLLLQPVVASIALGNIELLMAAAIVAGFRWPATWSFILLSKVTPGVGLVWFAVRREWRSLAIAIGVTAAIAGVSFVLAPRLWTDWFDLLGRNRDVDFRLATLPGPLALRVALAAVLIAWGGRTDRRWTVPVGAAIAVPVGYFTLFAIMAVGVAGIAIRTPGFTIRGTIVAVTARLMPWTTRHATAGR
ncbi:MAG TPA: glycosyltransferase family 87 protein [Candidatus Limnocylindrales bacterium]